MGLRRDLGHVARSPGNRRLPHPSDATRPERLRRWMVSDPLTDRQWGAYVAACAERDRYREALESIANPYVHDAEAQTWIARAALGLDGENQ